MTLAEVTPTEAIAGAIVILIALGLLIIWAESR